MKSKIAKKVIAASLATVMAVSLAACGNEPAPTTGSDTPDASTSEQSSAPEASTPEESSAPEASTPEASTPEEEVSPYTVLTDENGNVYDLGGMEIIMRDWWSGDPVEPNNDYEEARDAYREWIQETYNFTFKQQAISDWGSAPQDFVDYATAGGDENYIFILREAAPTTSAMNQGLMYDLATLDCLDFSEAKWGPGVHKLMSKGDSIYCMYAGDTEPRSGIFFNKRLLEDAGVEPNKPYELQEAGEWTWDAFTDLCNQVQRDLDNDGVIDVAGMTQNHGEFINYAVFSNNGDYIGQENGQYVYKLESDETLEALNWAVDAIADYGLVPPEGAEWDYYKQAWVNGEAVFCTEGAYCAGPNGQWSTMEDEYGFVCFPKGPKASDYTNIYSNNPVAIPACYDAEKAWKLAFAYNLWTDPVPGYEDYQAWKPNYYNNFPDTEAVDYTITRMMTNGRVTYHGLIPNLDLGNDLVYGLPGSVVSEKVEAIRDTWQAYIAEANQ